MLNLKYKQKDLILPGETSWDWYKNREGTFQITLKNLAEVDNFIIIEALRRAIRLTEKILISGKFLQENFSLINLRETV